MKAAPLAESLSCRLNEMISPALVETELAEEVVCIMCDVHVISNQVGYK